jgi:hypothetical protein
MSTYKRISGDYTIQSVGVNDVININSSMVTINGNLQVSGNSQTIVSTNSAITDNKITLNHGLSNSSPPNSAGAAIEVDRGTGANVQLRWSETVQNWQITTDGTTYANILTSTGAGLSNVYSDSSPAISANLDLRGRRIWNSNIASQALVGNVSLFISNVGTGGSGIYANNTSYINGELINKTRSVAYSILFG